MSLPAVLAAEKISHAEVLETGAMVRGTPSAC